MNEKHEIFSKLGAKYSSFVEGAFTTYEAGSVQAVDERPGLLVMNGYDFDCAHVEYVL